MTQLRTNEIDETHIRNVLFTHRHDDHSAGARYLFQRSKHKGFQGLDQISAYMSDSTYRHLQIKFNKLDHHGNPVPFDNVVNKTIQSYERFSIDMELHHLTGHYLIVKVPDILGIENLL